jgi:hypothetical protein
MKIKRFKNLWTMGLILSAAILGVVYLMKIFFPEFVIEVAHTDSIVAIGRYIDTHKWAWYLANGIISFAVLYLHCCACCQKRKLNTKETIIIICTIVGMFFVKNILPNQFTVLNLLTNVILPFVMKGNFKATVVCFSAINLLQTLTLEIRGLAALVTDYNFATLIILMIDIYIVQVLLYFLFNYEKEN